MSIGQQVTWLYSPRGGYGYVIPVDGVVEEVKGSRVRIQVRKTTGEVVSRWVKTEKVRAR